MTHAMRRRDLWVAARVLIVLTALWLTCAVAVSGQVAPQGTDAGLLRWFQGDREIGRESFRRTPALLETETQVPMLNLVLRYRSEYDTQGRLVRFEGRAVDPRADTVVRTYTAVFDGDTVRMRQVGGRPADSSWVRAARAEAVVGSQSLAAMADLIQRAGGRDGSAFTWSPERNDTVRFQVSFGGDSADVRWMGMPMVARVGPTGRVEQLEIATQRLRAVRWNGRDSLPPLEGSRRPTPDYSAPPGAPYAAEEVRVPVRTAAGDTFSLACTLTIPRAGRAPYPAAVTITGSGLQDRDESLWPLVPEYRPFRQVVERLAASGIAALRCDDRGFGGSGGDVRNVTSQDFADDVTAQLGWLEAQPRIARTRLALVGHSEGGIIAPMVGRMHAGLAAMVLMAGTAKNGVAVLRDQVTWPIVSAPGLGEERKRELIAQAVSQIEQDTTPVPWLRWFRSYDPLPTARRVRQPVLILQGALDRQVTAGQADTLGAAIRAGGNRDVTVRVFPGLNHLFVLSPTDGSPSEYASLRGATMAPEVLDVMAAWLAQRLRATGAGRRAVRD